MASELVKDTKPWSHRRGSTVSQHCVSLGYEGDIKCHTARYGEASERSAKARSAGFGLSPRFRRVCP